VGRGRRSSTRVHVAAFTSVDAAANEFAAAVRERDIPFLALPETRRVDPSHLGAIRRYVAANGIGVVHAHGYRSDLLSYIATRGPGRPALVTTHHGWIRNSRRQELVTRAVLQLCRRFDGVEVVSNRLLDELPGSVRRRAAVVHNAVVLDDYAPLGGRAGVRAELGLAEDAIVLGVIGRISLEKGCLEMIDALARLAPRHPRVRLVFIGEGPLAAAVAARSEAAGVSDRVVFAGHRSPVRPCYEGLDLLVSPSRTEGISNVILEALTMGLPVVATRVGGTPEILEDGDSGLLVPASNPAALADAIERVVGDTALAGRLATGGRARVEAEFSFEARMRKEEAFYDGILGRRR
jgi:glycosyltransferase involved in cell wall biosynthesis